MKILRSILLFISTASLRFLIFFGITVLCLVIVFGNKENIKSSIKETNAYDRFVTAVIQETAKTYHGETTIPLDNPEVQKIIKNAFPAELLETSTETFIDGIYAWLEGDTNTPEYTVDFTQARQNLANSLSAYAFNRLSSQPVCFAIPENIDPFTAGCQPPYTDLSVEQKKLADAIAGEEGFLPKAIFTEQDLPKDQSGERIYEKFSYAPKAYQWSKLFPWLLAGVLVLLAISSVLLHRSRRRGFQQLGYILTGSGIALLMTPILFTYVLPRFSDSLQFQAAGNDNPAQQVISDIGNDLITDLNMLLINISIYVIVAGAVIIIAEKYSRTPSGYLGAAKKSGIASSNPSKPSKTGRKYKPDTIPVQSSEESKRRAPRKVKNKKYRKIPKKEI